MGLYAFDGLSLESTVNIIMLSLNDNIHTELLLHSHYFLWPQYGLLNKGSQNLHKYGQIFLLHVIIHGVYSFRLFVCIVRP